jgi:formamidopyrimidine-DNA glycosylase
LGRAKLHPEQYCNTFSDEQIGHLHESLTGVCKTACDLLADSSQFPEDWLMKYRWDKGKKGATNKLPNGAKIEHITVGGRTSAFVPSVQKKTAAVAGDMVKEESEDDKRDKQPTRGKKRKIEVEAEEQEEEEEDEVLPAKKPRSRRGKSDDVNASGDAERSKRGKPEKAAPSKTMKADPDPEATKKKKKETATTESENPASGARRSSRNKGK